MREPMLVDHAAIAPFACKCTNTTGPLLDTFFEDAAGRVYICKRCARSYARLFGFAPGKKLDELSDVAGILEERDQELAKLNATIEELRLQGGSDRSAIKDLRARLEAASGVLQATRHMAASMEQSAHELVEAVAPAAPVEVAA